MKKKMKEVYHWLWKLKLLGKSSHCEMLETDRQ
jgi:hypothetical protein